MFGGEVFPACRGERVVAGALAFVGKLPGSGDPAFGFQAVERGIKRAGFHLKLVFGGALDVFGDGVAVAGAGEKCTEDQKVERALQKVEGHYVDSLQHIE